MRAFKNTLFAFCCITAHVNVGAKIDASYWREQYRKVEDMAFAAGLRMRAKLSPGNRTWDESCNCPSADKPMPDGKLYEQPGFDEPITCKNMLCACASKLQGASKEELNEQLKELLHPKAAFDADGFGRDDRDDFDWKEYWNNWPKIRCQIATLICLGADPDSKRRGSDHDAMHMAVWHNDYHLVTFLREHNASAPDYSSFIPFYSRDKKVIEELCAYETPSAFIDLRYVMDKKYDPDGSLAEMLIKTQKMAIDQRDACGFTPFLSLARNCMIYSQDEVEIMKKKAQLLIEAGAHVHARVQHGFYAGKNALELVADQQEEKDCTACKAFGEYLKEVM